MGINFAIEDLYYLIEVVGLILGAIIFIYRQGYKAGYNEGRNTKK